MATSSSLLDSVQDRTLRESAARSGGALRRDLSRGALLSALLTLYAVLIEGYHPFAEDGGLYLAGVRALLNPDLYKQSRPFVTAHLHYSLFAPLLACAVKKGGMTLEAVVLLMHVLCVWTMLLATFLIARELFARPTERFGAMLLLAAWLGLPVAGTSLTIADPYLTARSFSTPCVLMAFAAALRSTAQAREGRTKAAARAGLLSAGVLLLGVLMHPLMAGYGAVCIGAYFLTEMRSPLSRVARWVGGALAAVVMCLVLAKFAPAESAASRMVSLTRTYWFPAQWAWFELLGLGAPLILLAAFALKARGDAERRLARACLVAGSYSVMIAMLFAHAGSRSLIISRLQPLRLFQVVYLVMTILLGGLLGRLLGARRARWALAAVVLGVAMTIPAHSAFPASAWLELPSRGEQWVRRNAWSSAFLWARNHTPVDALFAVDANYISLPGEDAQSFRALAERSVLPDLSKDGGEAAITPALARPWEAGVAAQESLSGRTAVERRSLLLPLGVTWMVLQSTAKVDSTCPYDNGVVRVCPLR